MMMKKHDADEEKVFRIAVIGSDGIAQYRDVPRTNPIAPPTGKGKVVFPFAATAVHSESWKATDHVFFIPKDGDKG